MQRETGKGSVPVILGTANRGDSHPICLPILPVEATRSGRSCAVGAGPVVADAVTENQASENDETHNGKGIAIPLFMEIPLRNDEGG